MKFRCGSNKVRTANTSSLLKTYERKPNPTKNEDT